MQQMCRYGITGVFLAVSAWYDIKTRKVPIIFIFLFGMAGIIMNIMFSVSAIKCMQSMGIGMFLLLLGKVTGEQVGYGDGLIFIVTGLFLEGKENLLLFFTGLFLCACTGIFLLIIKRAARKTELPFIPFLACAYVFQVFHFSGGLL